MRLSASDMSFIDRVIRRNQGDVDITSKDLLQHLVLSSLSTHMEHYDDNSESDSNFSSTPLSSVSLDDSVSSLHVYEEYSRVHISELADLFRTIKCFPAFLNEWRQELLLLPP